MRRRSYDVVLMNTQISRWMGWTASRHRSRHGRWVAHTWRGLTWRVPHAYIARSTMYPPPKEDLQVMLGRPVQMTTLREVVERASPVLMAKGPW